MNSLLKAAHVRKFFRILLELGKAKIDNIFAMILFSRKSLLIAISVAHFIISLAGSSW